MATKHCCYGTCRSDSRYMHTECMKNVFFIPFPKPYAKKCNEAGIEKCKRWVHACRRQGFDIANVKKDTYICSLHFVGGNGPTADHPDPIPATATELQVEKFKRKRKLPTNQLTSTSTQRKVQISVSDLDLIAANGLLSLSRSVEHGPQHQSTISALEDINTPELRLQQQEHDVACSSVTNIVDLETEVCKLKMNYFSVKEKPCNR